MCHRGIEFLCLSFPLKFPTSSETTYTSLHLSVTEVFVAKHTLSHLSCSSPTGTYFSSSFHLFFSIPVRYARMSWGQHLYSHYRLQTQAFLFWRLSIHTAWIVMHSTLMSLAIYWHAMNLLSQDLLSFPVPDISGDWRLTIAWSAIPSLLHTLTLTDCISSTNVQGSGKRVGEWGFLNVSMNRLDAGCAKSKGKQRSESEEGPFITGFWCLTKQTLKPLNVECSWNTDSCVCVCDISFLGFWSTLLPNLPRSCARLSGFVCEISWWNSMSTSPDDGTGWWILLALTGIRAGISRSNLSSPAGRLSFHNTYTT